MPSEIEISESIKNLNEKYFISVLPSAIPFCYQLSIQPFFYNFMNYLRGINFR